MRNYTGSVKHFKMFEKISQMKKSLKITLTSRYFLANLVFFIPSRQKVKPNEKKIQTKTNGKLTLRMSVSHKYAQL